MSNPYNGMPGPHNAAPQPTERLAWNDVPVDYPVQIAAGLDPADPNTFVRQASYVSEALGTNDLHLLAEIKDYRSGTTFWAVGRGGPTMATSIRVSSPRHAPNAPQNVTRFYSRYMIVHPPTFRESSGGSGFLGIHEGVTTVVNGQNPKVRERFGLAAPRANFEVSVAADPEGNNCLFVVHHSDQRVDMLYLAPAPWKNQSLNVAHPHAETLPSSAHRVTTESPILPGVATPESGRSQKANIWQRLGQLATNLFGLGHNPR